jgi:hypothetical protein
MTDQETVLQVHEKFKLLEQGFLSQGGNALWSV